MALLLCAVVTAPALAGVEEGTALRADAPARPVVVRVGEDGFHWRDAALGAAAALAAGLVGLGLVLTVRQARDKE